ncbi:YraN family protein [Parabacteroides sp. PF5-9]|uniref:YraN family protein n=1 Tax=Parabacteroides sp. PF5-9 TaxID=1742404 RepID=UPI002475B754|nr:YraN family protein [Parabacteroides sp. PF5-9]MDH6356680.1 putative endonuclease [Parabacteroides sp. PF5-9]
MAERNETGKRGEEEAQTYLKQAGYELLHTNWRWHHFELDIVASTGDELVVIEVKTRSVGYLLSPEESVDMKKIRRIVRAADAYVRRFGIALPVRFDIITLIKHNEGYTIEHLEDAFYAPVK